MLRELQEIPQDSSLHPWGVFGIFLQIHINHHLLMINKIYSIYPFNVKPCYSYISYAISSQINLRHEVFENLSLSFWFFDIPG